MVGDLRKRLRRLYLWFVGGVPDETTAQGTADLDTRLKGLDFKVSEEEEEAGDRLQKSASNEGDSLAATVYNARPRNPFSD